MFINWYTITHLPVFTESGQKLGAISEVEIDIATHSIRKYIVTRGIVGKENFLVMPLQIKSITTEKIVVEDAVIKAAASGEVDISSDPVLGSMAP